MTSGMGGVFPRRRFFLLLDDKSLERRQSNTPGLADLDGLQFPGIDEVIDRAARHSEPLRNVWDLKVLLVHLSTFRVVTILHHCTWMNRYWLQDKG